MLRKNFQLIAASMFLLGIAVPSAQAATPTVKTGSASNVAATSATVAGALNPNGAPTSWYFQYGPTATYGSQTATQYVAASHSAVNVSAALGSLNSATKYHYRLVALNASGASTGGDATFTTHVVPLSLAVSASENPTVYGSTVALNGTLSGTNNGGRAVQLLANPFPYLPLSASQPAFEPVGNSELTSSTGAFSFVLMSAPTVTTQYQVDALVTPAVQSPVLTLSVALNVTGSVRRSHAHSGFTARFSGVIRPAQDGARVGVERLTSSGWKAIAGALATHDSPSASRYSVAAHLAKGGDFRVIVLPLDSGQLAAGYSPELLVHALHR